MIRAQRARVRPKQSLGQNFLVDDNIARNIVRSLELKPTDVVLEVGPGQGALTPLLAKGARHVVAVEIDGRMVDSLKESLSSENVTILHQDILAVSFLHLKMEFGDRLRIVGNLPYHLTSEILFKAFDERIAVRDVTVMVQKEVARRLVASPGGKEYGILSVCTQFYGKSKVLFDVSPNCFYPKPKVTSSVVRITIGPEISPDVDERLFRTTVRTVFGKRRKTLRNGLKYLPFSETDVERILTSVRMPLDQRPEQLSVAQFTELTKDIKQILNS